MRVCVGERERERESWVLSAHNLCPEAGQAARVGPEAGLYDPSRTGGPDVIRKEACSFYRTSSGVRLCWELQELEGPKGS